MNFKIVDGNSVNYEEAKQDYINGIIGKALCEKHGMGRSQYIRLLRRFREEGIVKGKKFYGNGVTNPKWYRTLTASNGKKAYEVRRMFNKKMYRFGRYQTEEEAKQRVKELNETGWDGHEF